MKYPFRKIIMVVVAAVVVSACEGPPSEPNAPAADLQQLQKATKRPLSDFLSAQGVAATFVPPVMDHLGWFAFNENYQRLVLVDYAGLADQWLGGILGTTIAGSVVEQPLPDGRARVHVTLHTENALAFAVDANTGDMATGTLLFGARAPDVAGGATPALATSHFEIEFKNTASGAPLPDFTWAILSFWGLPAPVGGYPWPGFEPISLKFNANATGPLRAAAGFGPDGTPGRMEINQNMLPPQTQQGGCPKCDQWPVERIDLHRIK